MNTIAIITSRWASTRLPGKVLIDIGGKPLLRWIVDGVRVSNFIDEVVVATTVSSQPIIQYCKQERIPFYVSNEEDDILSRLYGAARQFKADEVVRVWGDSVFIGVCLFSIMEDHQVTKGLFEYELYEDIPTSYKVAIFPFKSLAIANREATDLHDRKWAHNYMMKRFEGSLSICHHRDMEQQGNCLVDTPEDLEQVREIYARSQTAIGK